MKIMQMDGTSGNSIYTGGGGEVGRDRLANNRSGEAGDSPTIFLPANKRRRYSEKFILR